MMNEIILNGISNTEINGLIIQSLSPIAKPKIRTQIEEIEGRDGDIVTKLGYGAYDKEINIGLSYNYDVDEIIKYFDSEGTVTFSNEPNKYYNYQILEQIDFQRLIRFKTAVVKMHVQPFKYSTIETIKSFDTNNAVVRNSGNYFSRPKFTIYGSGTINLSINNLQIFVIQLGEEGYITIDSAKMEAYKDAILKNRLVTGDYENCILDIGNNTINLTGNVTNFQIENYSRWI